MSDREGMGQVRFYLVAALVGGLVGLIGAAFHALLDQANRGQALLARALAEAPVPGWLVLMVLGALILTVAMWLVRRFAPETAGSGIQEVEAILAGNRSLRWQRVLPIKFIAGVLAIGSGLVLGREGPTVHMGSALGKMAADWAHLDLRHGRSLIAAGAAAGLAAAFNAPLAAIVFVTEELREHFEYGFASIQSVILACCIAVIVSGWMLGQGPVLPIHDLTTAPLAALPLFLVLGILIGALGVLFNRLLLGSVRVLRTLRERHALVTAGAGGMVLGALVWFAPDAVGGGEGLVESLLHRHPGTLFLALLLGVRILTTVGSYGLGLPGGIFAPMLALGTIAGAACDGLVQSLAPGLDLSPGLFAVAAMGALFAATVRAPLTGIILVIELTGAQDLGLPIILTCLSATFTAEGLGGRPIYGLLLAQSERPPAPLRTAAGRLLVSGIILAVLLALPLINPVLRGEGTARVQSSPGGLEAPIVAPVAEDLVRTTVLNRTAGSPAPDGAPPAPDQRQSPVSDAEADRWSPRQGTAMPSAVQSSTSPQPLSPPIGSDPLVKDQARYFIQLISFRKPASVPPFARRHGILAQVRTLETRHRGQGWYPVLLGEFRTRQEAAEAVARLPADLGRLGPTIRVLPAGERLLPIQ